MWIATVAQAVEARALPHGQYISLLLMPASTQSRFIVIIIPIFRRSFCPACEKIESCTSHIIRQKKGVVDA